MDSSIAGRFEAKLDAIRQLLIESGASLGYLFGSAAKEAERFDPDLDVAGFLGRAIPLDRYGGIRLRLTTELVGLTHTNDVDVIILNVAPPLLAFEVVKGGRLFFGNRREQTRFEVRAIQN